MSNELHALMTVPLPMQVLVVAPLAPDAARLAAALDPKLFRITQHTGSERLVAVNPDTTDAIVFVVPSGFSPSQGTILPSQLWVPLLYVLPENDNSLKKWAMSQRASDIMVQPFSSGAISTRLHRLILEYPEKIKSRFTAPTMLELLRALARNRCEHIVPELDIAANMAHSYPAMTGILQSKNGTTVILEVMADLGLLQRRVTNRIHCCPLCMDYRINYREICPKCGSIEIIKTPMLHHFACGLVSPVSQFRWKEELICPKCHKKLQLLGLDYEKPLDYFHCGSCEYNFSEPAIEAQCLHCSNLCKPHETREYPIYSYEVTPLARQVREAGSFSVGGSVSELLRDRVYLCPRTEMEAILKQEFEQAKITQNTFCLLMVQVSGMDEGMRGEDLDFRMKEIGQTLGRGMRTSDSQGIWGPGRYLAIMPGTPESGGEATIRRMMRNMTIAFTEMARPMPELSFSLQTYDPERFSQPEQMLAKAEQDLSTPAIP